MSVSSNFDLQNLSLKPRVLYSFPFRIGADRICTTAWYQATEAAKAGARITLLAGSVAKPLSPEITLRTTLAFRNFRIPYRLLGRRYACNFHDWRTANWLRLHGDQVDIAHVWPGAALRTARVAKRWKIPVLAERPNAHTAYAYEAAEVESRLTGVQLPKNHDHRANAQILAQEEKEYQEADFLLCPSEFVAQTFRDRGIERGKLLRHHYGFDEKRFFPGKQDSQKDVGLIALYAGVCEPRKGLHYALEAWLASEASKEGTFLIAGDFVPGYAQSLSPMLAHPSIRVIGHRKDLPEQMRKADVFILSSVEEGSALVTYEAMASGCVLLVSDATGAPCRNSETGLVHRCRDVKQLTAHICLVESNKILLHKLRKESLIARSEFTWIQAGAKLKNVYVEAIRRCDANGNSDKSKEV